MCEQQVFEHSVLLVGPTIPIRGFHLRRHYALAILTSSQHHIVSLLRCHRLCTYLSSQDSYGKKSCFEIIKGTIHDAFYIETTFHFEREDIFKMMVTRGSRTHPALLL